MAAAATPGAEAPPAQPLLALCVAAEARVGRGPQLLACVPGTELLVAAAGSHLLVLRAGTGGMRPAEMLLTAAASIAAVAVYSSSSGGSGGGGSGSGGQRWAAALAGGTAHVVPVDLGSSGASDAGSVSFEASGRKLDWHSCAWHPAQAVCAVVAPQQLLLVSPVRPQPAGGEGGSGSSAAEGGSGDVSSRVLAAVPFPGCGSTATCAAAGRCCVAWLGGGGGGGRRGGTVWRVAVSQGPNLELLTFDSDWQLLERRQLLVGLAGPVCGLAAMSEGRLLVATQRPLVDWLSMHSEQPPQENQQQQAAEVDEVPSVLLRGLQAAQQRKQQEVALPASPPGGGGHTPRQHLPPPPAEALPLAAAVGAAERAAGSPQVLDLTLRHVRRASSAPAIPAHFLLDSGDHMPLEAGLPSLPLSARTEAGAEGGQVAVLWLEGSSSPAANPTVDGSAAAARVAAAEELGLAADLVVSGPDSLLLLASSRLSPPVLLLCTAGGHRLLPRGAPVRLPLPADIPGGCSVKLRGLALSSPAAGSSGSSSSSEQLVWALLAAAPRPKAAPFFSAPLAGDSPQQLWLCCYPLQQLVQHAEAMGSADAAPVAAPAVQQQQQQDGGGAALDPRPAAPLPAARVALSGSAPAPAVHAVQALQGEVAALRRELNARLDGLATQLDGVLRALQRQ